MGLQPMAVQAQAAQMVYRLSEGDDSMGELLGGKGSNLCEMTRLGGVQNMAAVLRH